MRWTAYPTDGDRKARRGGTPREGERVSDAPPPGGAWCLDEDRQWHLVITRAGESWEVSDDPG